VQVVFSSVDRERTGRIFDGDTEFPYTRVQVQDTRAVEGFPGSAITSSIP